MPTTQKLVTFTLDADLQRRLRRAASEAGKSVSGYVRDVLEARLRARRPPGGLCPLLRVAGMADGELAGVKVDDEIYGSAR